MAITELSTGTAGKPADTEAERPILSRAESLRQIELLRIAYVHLTLRSRGRKPHKVPPVEEFPNPDTLSIEQFRVQMTRRISTWTGQPERCSERACRRAKVCHGDPPDCWRAEPPPTPLELSLAKGLIRYRFSQRLAELNGGKED